MNISEEMSPCLSSSMARQRLLVCSMTPPARLVMLWRPPSCSTRSKSPRSWLASTRLSETWGQENFSGPSKFSSLIFWYLLRAEVVASTSWRELLVLTQSGRKSGMLKSVSQRCLATGTEPGTLTWPRGQHRRRQGGS